MRHHESKRSESRKLSDGNRSENWIERRVLFTPDRSLWWSRSHAMVPTPFKLKDDLFRIYYSGRNEANQSHIGWFDLDVSSDPRVVRRSREPVLYPGALGCFDDNGVTPSCVVKLPSGELALYYIGWNPGSTVRMNLFGGLAVSRNGGDTFERWSQAPILERISCDPFFNTAPWVVRVPGGLRMYYVSVQEWVHPNLPRYNIKVAHSSDGFNWVRDGRVVVDFAGDEDALARPFVISSDGSWRIWFSSKGDNYRIVCADSVDGLTWTRTWNGLGLEPAPGDIGSKMVEYAAIVEGSGAKWMLYNGDNYGEVGIGIARMAL